MPTPPSYTEEDKIFIGSNLEVLSYPQIAKERNLSLSCVKRVARQIKKNKLTKPTEPKKVIRTKPTEPKKVIRTEPKKVIRTEPTETKTDPFPKTYSTESVSQLVSDFDKEREETQEQIDSLNFKNTNLLQDKTNLQEVIKKQIFQIENHSNELLDLETTIENLSKIKTSSFTQFIKKLKSSNSISAKQIKSRINQRGKYKRANRGRVLTTIHEILDILEE